MMKLNEKEQNLINEIDARFPEKEIGLKVELFLALDPKDRLDAARTHLKLTERAFCPQMDVKFEFWQSVHEHQENMKKINRLLGGDKAIESMSELHDLPEAITSDFTIRDEISKQEKHDLEYIVAGIIFEGYPELYDMWKRYELRADAQALATKDNDILELMNTANHMERQQPDRHERFHELWETSKGTLKTEWGKVMYEELMQDRELVHKGEKPTSIIYKTVFGGAVR